MKRILFFEETDSDVLRFLTILRTWFEAPFLFISPELETLVEDANRGTPTKVEFTFTRHPSVVTLPLSMAISFGASKPILGEPMALVDHHILSTQIAGLNFEDYVWFESILRTQDFLVGRLQVSNELSFNLTPMDVINMFVFDSVSTSWSPAIDSSVWQLLSSQGTGNRTHMVHPVVLLPTPQGLAQRQAMLEMQSAAVPVSFYALIARLLPELAAILIPVTVPFDAWMQGIEGGEIVEVKKMKAMNRRARRSLFFMRRSIRPSFLILTWRLMNLGRRSLHLISQASPKVAASLRGVWRRRRNSHLTGNSSNYLSNPWLRSSTILNSQLQFERNR